MRLLTQARLENWLGKDLGSWRWWVLVALIIVPWFVWYKLADKKRLVELVMFGLIVMVFTITLDELGFSLSLWSYPVDVIWIFPRLTSVDYTAVPIIFMLLYQYFSTWKSFFWALVALSTLFSFVLEPSIVYFEFYILIKWSYLYSFNIYIIMGLISRLLARILVDITSKHSGR